MDNTSKGRLDLDAVRERLRTKRGPEFWRSLDELAETSEFQDLLHREFPRHASEWGDDANGVSRRGFLQLASASLALAGLTACTKQPTELIVPYVKQPEQLVPGKPLFFATALTVGGYATGVLAESHQGRPTKIEGNPDHPASLGATDVFAQASVLSLYDPERSQTVLRTGRPATWGAFVSEANAALRALQPQGGEGLRLLTGTVTSPTLAGQIEALLQKYPRARWHRWEPAASSAAQAAAMQAFGRPLGLRYDFTQAKVVVTLGGDVLAEGPGSVRYARDFTDGRRVRKDRPEMNRLYAVESFPTCTGSVADHRLQLAPPQLEAFVLALAQGLGVATSGSPADPKVQKFLQAVIDDLKANPGASLVIADEYASPAVQVLVHAINRALGNAGKTVIYTEPVEVAPADGVDSVQSLAELVADMNAGRVDVLLMLDGVNPVYTAPADLPFAAGLKKVRVAVHHGLYEDETSGYCRWHVNAAHELESWGDARAFDGTVSLQQPLIEPLYGGRASIEVLAALSDKPDATSYDLVREFWSTRLDAAAALGLSQGTDPGGVTTSRGFGGLPGTMASTVSGPVPANFDTAWQRVLHAGLIPNTQAPPVAAPFSGGAVQQAVAQMTQITTGTPGDITLLLRPDPTVRDGSLAPNAWLQECPKPISKLTWDNALMLSPKTAQRLKLETEEMTELTVPGGHRIKAAVWIQPGVADDTALLHLGYGRQNAGKATGAGFNAYPLRTIKSLWAIPGATLRGLGDRYPLASTQNHHLLDPGWEEMKLASEEAREREVIRHGTLEQFRQDPDFIQKQREKPAADDTLYPQVEYKGHAWGMSIDLNACTGCSACVVACQAENNIPVVGKEQVLKHRAMHWIRIDRYFSGDIDEPTVHHQPVPCMQCENAPCEVVCPVAATVHSDEGLNDMVYNRCVGTRYCSNNCPYKVRRFNFLRYSDRTTPVLALLENPDVTVRMRGVMEKCTYCVQRIEEAKIESKVEGRPIPPNWLKTACQQACPTRAIVFGDVNDQAWEVTKLKAEPLNYGLLEELNTRPRTTYLAKLRNPNPSLEGAEHGDA